MRGQGKGAEGRGCHALRTRFDAYRAQISSERVSKEDTCSIVEHDRTCESPSVGSGIPIII